MSGQSDILPLWKVRRPVVPGICPSAVDVNGATPFQRQLAGMKFSAVALFGKWLTGLRLRGDWGIPNPVGSLRHIFRGIRHPSNAFSINSSPPSRERRRKAIPSGFSGGDFFLWLYRRGKNEPQRDWKKKIFRGLKALSADIFQTAYFFHHSQPSVINGHIRFSV